MNDARPLYLTSYDLLKTLAVLLMIADHVGYYLFPDDSIWRLAGRFCVPVWFFLIGYAHSRNIGPDLLIGLGVLLTANVITGMSIVPLNILATIIAVRLVIDPVMNRALSAPRHFWSAAFCLMVLVIPTGFLCEYGSLGLILAIFGYLVRQWQDKKRASSYMFPYLGFTLVVFTSFQGFTFDFSSHEKMILAAGTALVLCGLLFFRAADYPQLTARLPRAVTAVLKFTGRRTLEIYVGHLIILKFAALLMGDERMGWFDVVFFSATGA